MFEVEAIYNEKDILEAEVSTVEFANEEQTSNVQSETEKMTNGQEIEQFFEEEEKKIEKNLDQLQKELEFAKEEYKQTEKENAEKTEDAQVLEKTIEELEQAIKVEKNRIKEEKVRLIKEKLKKGAKAIVSGLVATGAVIGLASLVPGLDVVTKIAAMLKPLTTAAVLADAGSKVANAIAAEKELNALAK